MHLFFIQLDPDIDYITPIVYKLAMSDANNVMVICFNPLHNISSDYRLQYLINDLNVRVMHLYQINKLVNLVCSPAFWVIRMLPSGIRVKFHAIITKTIIKKKWFELFLREVSPCSITIDEAIPNHAKFIVDLSKKINIVTVVVPTGVHMVQVLEASNKGDRCCFDYKIIAPNAPPSENEEKMKIHRMGFTRYSEEWQAINIRLLDGVKDKYPLPNEEGMLKVVIFGRPAIKFDREHRLVKRIARESNIAFIFKDKPRVLTGGTYDKYPSALLIRWADVVITSISSIILDILYHNKLFIYPRYLAPNDIGVFENSGVCLGADSEENLIDILRCISEQGISNNLKSDDRVNFYNSMVYRKENFANHSLDEFSKLYETIAIKNINLRFKS
jgi:hypothetical protein